MQTLLGLIVFAILVALGFAGLQAGGSVPQALIVLLSAAVGFGVWRSQENAKRAQDLEAKLVSDKKTLYKVYLDVLREVVEKSESAANEAATAAILKRLRAFVFGSLLIASDEVVLAHDRFLNASRVSDELVMPAVADVILAMRRDAGGEDTALLPIDVLATFIKAEDIDKMKPLCDQWAKEKAKAWPVSRQPVVKR